MTPRRRLAHIGSGWSAESSLEVGDEKENTTGFSLNEMLSNVGQAITWPWLSAGRNRV